MGNCSRSMGPRHSLVKLLISHTASNTARWQLLTNGNYDTTFQLGVVLNLRLKRVGERAIFFFCKSWTFLVPNFWAIIKFIESTKQSFHFHGPAERSHENIFAPFTAIKKKIRETKILDLAGTTDTPGLLFAFFSHFFIYSHSRMHPQILFQCEGPSFGWNEWSIDRPRWPLRTIKMFLIILPIIQHYRYFWTCRTNDRLFSTVFLRARVVTFMKSWVTEHCN